MKKLIVPFLFFLLVFLLSFSNAFAGQTIITDVIDDNYLMSWSPSTNYSTLNTWQISTTTAPHIGYNLVYLKFNISSLPTNISITNAFISAYADYSRSGTNRNITVYNVSNAWTEENITWTTKPANSVLQSNSTHSWTITGWHNFTVTDAVNSSYNEQSNLVSFMLRDAVENATGTFYNDFRSKEYGSNIENLVIDWNLTDCYSTCGNCGCDETGNACHVPNIVGSYCAIEDGLNDTIKTVYANCSGTTYFTCPSGTFCSQVTPIFNFSETGVFTPENSTWCNGCWFINYLTGWPPRWVVWATNCYDSPFTTSARIKTECNCYGVYCANIYATNDTLTQQNFIPEWTAGCFNPSSGLYSNIINSTGQNTSIENLTMQYCPDCNLTNQTPTNCLANTSTTCYDENCNTVPCTTKISATCESNYGGQIALMVGSIFGITDCSVSEWFLVLIAIGSVCFISAYSARNSNSLPILIIFGCLCYLLAFTLADWLPSWVMVIIIVIIAYLIAKKLGIGD